MAERDSGRERRRHRRHRKRLQVRFGPGDLAHNGYSQDVSEGGIYLQAGIVYPPGTVLLLLIEYPEGAVTVRGVVRWSKDLPPAFKRSLRGGMGVEFVEPAAQRAAAKTAGALPAESAATRPARSPTPPAPAPRRGAPPEVGDAELQRGTSRRRQVSTIGGNTFEVIETEIRGAWYIRIYQLPRTDGSAEAVFRQGFWSREAADAAVRGFLQER